MKWKMELNQFVKTKAEENNVEQHGKNVTSEIWSVL